MKSASAALFPARWKYAAVADRRLFIDRSIIVSQVRRAETTSTRQFKIAQVLRAGIAIGWNVENDFTRGTGGGAGNDGQRC